ncbi:MAG: succinate dehydrogenase iron-sulfur subunit [Dehalococcoidia bacterium]
MQANIKVRRFNPETPSKEAHYQEFSVDVHESSSVLDALIKVREEVDGTLALRCSCRASICGSCSMRVNGQATLVCKTRLEEVAPNGEQITIDPMGNMPVIKDLVVDMKLHWDKVRAVDPYLRPGGPEPDGEYIAPNEAMEHLVGVMNCIMCGACVSDCTALEVDENFTGPAALAKAYRFVADPRDDTTHERLGKLNEYPHIWDCTRCYYCVEVCPKDVAPMDRIMKMRDMAIEDGYTNTPGYRHTESFVSSVRKHGRLDESRLAVDSVGWTNLPGLLDLAPVGLKALRKGKLPPIIPHKAEDHKQIRKIVDKLEDEAK